MWQRQHEPASATYKYKYVALGRGSFNAQAHFFAGPISVEAVSMHAGACELVTYCDLLLLP